MWEYVHILYSTRNHNLAKNKSCGVISEQSRSEIINHRRQAKTATNLMLLLLPSALFVLFFFWLSPSVPLSSSYSSWSAHPVCVCACVCVHVCVCACVCVHVCVYVCVHVWQCLLHHNGCAAENTPCVHVCVCMCVCMCVCVH